MNETIGVNAKTENSAVKSFNNNMLVVTVHLIPLTNYWIVALWVTDYSDLDAAHNMHIQENFYDKDDAEKRFSEACALAQLIVR